MANSKYTYDDFAGHAGNYGADITDADYAFAKTNPDAAMALLGYYDDLNAATAAGNDAAAGLARSAIDNVRAGYALPATSAPASYNGRDVTAMMKYLVGNGGYGTDATGDGRMNARDVVSMMRQNVAGATAAANGAAPTSAVPASSVPASAAPASVLPGEIVPGSGSYNGRDVTGTMKYLAGRGGSGIDATGDGRVNARDVTAMMRQAVANANAAANAPASAVTPEASPGEEAWVNPWGDQYNAAVLQYLSGNVDVEDSDVWRAYEAMYNREGLRAAEDFLGKAIAASGGRLSSGAAGSAAQAQQYFLSQLMDKYPEVRNQLLAEQLQRIDLLRDAEGTAYARHYQEGRDAIDDEWRAKEFARLLANDEVARDQWTKTFERGVFESDRKWEYGLTRDKIADAYASAQYMDYSGLQALGVDVSRYLADLDYQKQVDEAMKAASLNDYSLFDSLFGTSVGATVAAEEADKKALERAQALYELTGDTSGFAEYYGIPKAQIDSYLAQQAYLATAKSSGGGSGGSSGGSSKTTKTTTYGGTDAVTAFKNLPDPTKTRLEELAAARGTGAQAYLMELIEAGVFGDDLDKAIAIGDGILALLGVTPAYQGTAPSVPVSGDVIPMVK